MWQKTKNIYHFVQAFIGALIYRFPSKHMVVIGVTGTDGKSTTVNMLYHILKESGKNVSQISSIGAVIGNQTHDTGFHVTTPSSWQIQKYLQKAKKAGCEYFVLEATSHGLDQNRLAFINFKEAVLTNISEEHLDYHKNLENYRRAKLKLFKNAEYSIINADDESYDFFKKNLSGNIVSYSQHEQADHNLKNTSINLKIPGTYNLSNALAAASAASGLGIGKSQISAALSSFNPLKGRLEKINAGQKFSVYVDFAHTPNALKNVLVALKNLKPNTKSKLIAVFGSAGERDRSKRPKMGKVAADLADISVLTAEDPRREKVEDITSQIESGLKSKKQGRDYYKIYDRRQAIEFALKLAGPQDIVGVFGKGHEKTMCFGKKEVPWDEVEEVKRAIKKINV